MAEYKFIKGDTVSVDRRAIRVNGGSAPFALLTAGTHAQRVLRDLHAAIHEVIPELPGLTARKETIEIADCSSSSVEILRRRLNCTIEAVAGVAEARGARVLALCAELKAARAQTKALTGKLAEAEEARDEARGELREALAAGYSAPVTISFRGMYSDGRLSDDTSPTSRDVVLSCLDGRANRVATLHKELRHIRHFLDGLATALDNDATAVLEVSPLAAKAQLYKRIEEVKGRSKHIGAVL